MFEETLLQPPVISKITSFLSINDVTHLALVTKRFYKELNTYRLALKQIKEICHKNNLLSVKCNFANDVSDIYIQKLADLLTIADFENKAFSISFKIHILEQELSIEAKSKVERIRQGHFPEISQLECGCHYSILFFLSQLYLAKNQNKRTPHTRLSIALFYSLLALKDKPRDIGLSLNTQFILQLTLFSIKNDDSTLLTEFIRKEQAKIYNIFYEYFENKFNLVSNMGHEKYANFLTTFFSLVFEKSNYFFLTEKKIIPKNLQSVFHYFDNLDILVKKWSTIALLQTREILGIILNIPTKRLACSIDLFTFADVESMKEHTLEFCFSPQGNLFFKHRDNKLLTIHFLNAMGFGFTVFLQNNISFCLNKTLYELESIFNQPSITLENQNLPSNINFLFSRIPNLFLMSKLFQKDLTRVLTTFSKLTPETKRDAIQALKCMADNKSGNLLCHINSLEELIGLYKQGILEKFCNNKCSFFTDLLLKKINNLAGITVKTLPSPFNALFTCKNPDLILNYFSLNILEKNNTFLELVTKLVDKNEKFAAYFFKRNVVEDLLSLCEEGSLQIVVELDIFTLGVIKSNNISLKKLQSLLGFFSFFDKNKFYTLYKIFGLQMLLQLYNHKIFALDPAILKTLESYVSVIKLSSYRVYLLGAIFASCYKGGRFNIESFKGIVFGNSLNIIFFQEKNFLKALTMREILSNTHRKREINYWRIFLSLDDVTRQNLLEESKSVCALNIKKLTECLIKLEQEKNSQQAASKLSF